MCVLHPIGDCGPFGEEPFPCPIPKLHDDLNAEGQVWDCRHDTMPLTLTGDNYCDAIPLYGMLKSTKFNILTCIYIYSVLEETA